MAALMSADVVTIRIARLPHAAGLDLPDYASAGAAGLDVRAAVTEPLVIPPGKVVLAPTGLLLEIPPGYEVQMRPRSGLALKHGVTLLNSPGTIDSDYRGEVGVILANLGEEPFVLRRGDRIAQMVVAQVTKAVLVEVETVEDTARGAGGFGHTGLA